jgi:histidyl-tRNA synthetase
MLGNNSYSRKSLFESLSLEIPDKDNSLSSHPLLPIELLNFAVTILKQLSQKQIELTSISLTNDLFGIISLYSYQKKIQKSLKVHKYFKYFLSFADKLLSEKEDPELLFSVFSIIAKLTYNNESSQRYFFQKNGHKLMIKLMQKEFKQSNKITREALFCLQNCCQIKDFRLLLWSYGFIDVILMHTDLSLSGDSISGIPF